MDIENEIREEVREFLALIEYNRGGIVGKDWAADKITKFFSTLLERQREGIRAEILKLPTASIGKWDNEIVVIPRKDVLNLKSLQPTLKDNPQKE